MAYEGSSVAGSGIAVHKQLLSLNPKTGEAHLRGAQVINLNPEDASVSRGGVITQITVSTLPTLLPPNPLKYRRAISIFNHSQTNILYIGFDENINTGSAWPIMPLTSLPIDVMSNIMIWGVASSNIDVRIIELA